MTRIPSGTERGTFLAIDLGGTNCRICCVTLHGDSTYGVIQTKFPIASEVRVNASYRPLFAVIATKLGEFIDANLPRKGDAARAYNLGFTFSFTVDQISLAQGILIRWDKGWDIPEAVGKDPCALLQEAIDELGLPVKVCVLANDSVGTLLTRAYTSKSPAPTLAGVIFGTGTNAAYVERREQVTRLSATSGACGTNGVMVMNTEWGSFFDEPNDKEVLLSTTYDATLDMQSSMPGEQILEKRVSGMYLGELFRLVLLDLLHKNVLDMTLSKAGIAHELGGVDSSFLSALTAENDGREEGLTGLIRRNLSAENVSLADAVLLRKAAVAIVTRSARIAGAALAAIIIQSGLLESASGAHGKPACLPTASLTTRLSMSSSSYPRLRAAIERLVESVAKTFCISSEHPGPSSIASKNSISTSSQGSESGTVPYDDMIDIGVDGSLIQHCSGFEDEIRKALRQVKEVGPANEKKIRIGLAKDGSGVGAALMAQAAAVYLG